MIIERKNTHNKYLLIYIYIEIINKKLKKRVRKFLD